MKIDPIVYVPVWSTLLRLGHWIIALGSMVQILSAYLMTHDAINPDIWRDWHIIIGQIMVLALLLRGVLLFVPGSSHWRELWPRRSEFGAIVQMLKFYLSFGRFPLPRWFAHNPFWKPLYLGLWLTLTISAVSGLLFNAAYPILGMQTYTLHTDSALVIEVFVLFHIVAVILHDLKGRGARISAMINGRLYVHTDTGLPASTTSVANGPVRVSLDSITTPDRSSSDGSTSQR